MAFGLGLKFESESDVGQLTGSDWEGRLRTGPQIHLLTEIHRLDSLDAQRAAFRRAMADLAVLAAEQRPVPLEGLDPRELSAGIATCLEQGLVDDLSFLSPPAAAVALYQLASGLPKGTARNRMGKRVVMTLNGSDAETFAALCAALAMGSSDPFAEAGIQARVTLVLEMPPGETTAADALALALLARPQMRRDWVLLASSATLPSRRRAARILERAAREATRQCHLGDDGALQLFSNDAVSACWDKLLADRESLVWRHVAVARGLLLTVVPELSAQVEADLDSALSPTEWRRAGVSAVAAIAYRGADGIRSCEAIVSGSLARRDRGLCGAMIFGLASAAHSEPRVRDSLLNKLVTQGGDYALDTLIEHLREDALSIESPAVSNARNIIQEYLEDGGLDPVRRNQLALQLCQLEAAVTQSSDGQQPSETTLLPQALLSARTAFATHGPKEAGAVAQRVLDMATARLNALETAQDSSVALPLLWELDAALLQNSTLNDLLSMCDEPQQQQSKLEVLSGRLHRYLLAAERHKPGEGEPFGLHMRRLVILLHAVDTECAVEPAKQRRRQLETVHSLLVRVSEESNTPLGRVLCATLSRTFDALVRDRVFELSDVLLMAALYVHNGAGVQTLAEASMEPELERSLAAYAELVSAIEDMASGRADNDTALACLARFVRTIAVASSPRVEALRRTVLLLSRSLDELANARSLEELCDDDNGEMIARFADAVRGLGQLSAGALRRFSASSPYGNEMQTVQCLLELSTALELSVGTVDSVDWEKVLTPLFAALGRELPRPLAQLCRKVLSRLQRLPPSGGRASRRPPSQRVSQRRLPAWLPSSRVLGGFYVLDTLGEGAVGSVFVATRLEDRGKASAQRFALKVPAYDGQAAEALSEEEFLSLFRKEAGALLALPDDHPNLASFVTFDAGARPKPLLVMELVKGPNMAKLLARGRLTIAEVLPLLVDVADGLSAMHALGIGHLDVKPGNIIVREQDGGGRQRAVLVDFGLSGRQLRAGCATAGYGASEIWGLLPEPDYTDPRPADVYALACTAFELLTGRDLFSGNDDMSIVSAHISHDGRPAALEALGENPAHAAFVKLMVSALRRDPKDRISANEMSQGLSKLTVGLALAKWPLRPPSNVSAA